MTLDDQLRHTLDALSERLRGDITSYLERATKDLMQALEAERALISEQIARDVRVETEREVSVRLRTLEDNETIVSTKSAPARAVAAARGGAPIQPRVAAPAPAAGLAPEAEGVPAARQSPDVDFQRGRLPGDVAPEPDAARLLEGIRALDHSGSLSEILDILV